MPNLKEVKNRITSVNSTQQITKAMKMVAAAKLRKAQDKIVLMRPYAKKLGEILANVSASIEEDVENKYGTPRKHVNRVLVVVVTSDKGLCGGFNANVSKEVLRTIKEKYADLHAAGKVDILPIGKKGMEFFQRRNFPLTKDYVDLFSALSFENVKLAAEFVMNSFASGKYDHVDIAYNEFKNVVTQEPQVEQFLPIVNDESTAEVDESDLTDYIFEPSVEYIINDLIPKSLKVQFYKAVLESNAGEHGARMTAMDKATDNAGELLKELRLTYNRTRQAAITTEILEIVGGAEALAKGG